MHESVKPRRKRVRSPRRAWAWAAVALLAAVLLAASTLHFVTASCAATLALPLEGTPSASTLTQGQAYYYNPGGGVGSCSFGSLPADGLYVSLAAAQYAGGASCGSYLEVSSPDGHVQAEVVDLCPGCTDGGLDLSEAAFSRVAAVTGGTAEVSYRLVRDPQPAARLELRIASSASADWLALQVINNGNPVSSVAIAPAGKPRPARWQPLVLSSDDYWAAPAGAGAGPFKVRITDVFGNRVVARGIRLLPGSVQRTRVAMYSTAPSGQHPTASGPSAGGTTAPPRPGPSKPAALGTAHSADGGLGSHSPQAAHPGASGKPGPTC
ncbi:MAG: expansin EXLX1 family cellulose-binding protein [Streptosporangiaceae bacterium]